MNSTSIKCWVGALGLAALLAAPLPGEAQSKRFALACVSTLTDHKINFEYRWGKDAEWTAASVGPGNWQLLMWRYNRANENRSPPLQVRYDDDMSKRTNYAITDIEAYAASSENCEDQGKTYHFYVEDGELFLSDDEA
jgi:hypothetical protein